MSKHAKAYREPTHAEIMICAQGIYESQGRPEGKALEHWLQAESQLIAERKAQAGMLPAGAQRANWQTPSHQASHRN